MSDKKIPVVVSSSNEYVPYLSVFLQSLKDNIDVSRYYSIYILERNITSVNKHIIKEQIECKNIRLEFINLSESILDFSGLCKGKHFSVDTFSRFYIPQLLSDCDKCVYCDIDTIVVSDLAELYDLDLNGHPVAACRDAAMTSMYYDNISFWKKYFDETLGIFEPENYFQGGVLLLNLKFMRENNSTESLSKLAATNNLIFADQCIFNMYFKNNVEYIDLAWNYVIENVFMKYKGVCDLMPGELREQYLKSKHSPKIIHYAGDRKPWVYSDEEFASVWWVYAAKSPFYNEILIRQNSKLMELEALNKKKKFSNYIKYIFYFIISVFSIGKIHKKYVYKKLYYNYKLKTLLNNSLIKR